MLHRAFEQVALQRGKKLLGDSAILCCPQSRVALDDLVESLVSKRPYQGLNRARIVIEIANDLDSPLGREVHIDFRVRDLDLQGFQRLIEFQLRQRSKKHPFGPSRPLNQPVAQQQKSSRQVRAIAQVLENSEHFTQWSARLATEKTLRFIENDQDWLRERLFHRMTKAPVAEQNILHFGQTEIAQADGKLHQAVVDRRRGMIGNLVRDGL